MRIFFFREVLSAASQRFCTTTLVQNIMLNSVAIYQEYIYIYMNHHRHYDVYQLLHGSRIFFFCSVTSSLLDVVLSRRFCEVWGHSNMSVDKINNLKCEELRHLIRRLFGWGQSALLEFKDIYNLLVLLKRFLQNSEYFQLPTIIKLFKCIM